MVENRKDGDPYNFIEERKGGDKEEEWTYKYDHAIQKILKLNNEINI